MTRKRTFFRNNDGITPVLSNLLLTIIAVAVMAIATTATYVITNNLRENMSERVLIEDVWFDNSTGKMSIYLRNIGRASMQVMAVYVNHTSCLFNPASGLDVGSHRWLNVTVDWNANSVYYVDIVTTRGTHVGDYYKAS